MVMAFRRVWGSGRRFARTVSAAAARGEPRGEAHRLLERAGVGDALADDVERGAVRRRREDGLQARPVTVTPRLKPLSLVAIWPWSWYIVSTPSNSPAKALRNTVSAGKGPWQRCRASAALRDRRRDDLDLLAPEQPVLAAVRIERRHRDARLGECRRRAWCASASASASSMRSGVIWSSACAATRATSRATSTGCRARSSRRRSPRAA